MSPNSPESITTDKVKTVAVMMPFGGPEPRQRRRFILEFMRIKYIIENITTTAKSDASQIVKYDVKAFRTPIGNIPEKGLDFLAMADVLIGFLAEKNHNVMCEIAFRYALSEVLILIVQDPANLIPVYLTARGHIDYDEFTRREISDLLDEISENDTNYPDLTLSEAIPDDLAKKIDDHDGGLRNELTDALKEIEHNLLPRPAYMTSLFGNLDPGNVFTNWQLLHPFTVLRVQWKGKSDLSYTIDDLSNVPVVYSANNDLTTIFNITSIPDPDGPSALTAKRLFQKLDQLGVVNKRDLSKLWRDQQKVFEELILHEKFGYGDVALKINGKHRRCKYRKYKISFIGNRILGTINEPHTMYCLVVYFEVKYPILERIWSAFSNYFYAERNLPEWKENDSEI